MSKVLCWVCRKNPGVIGIGDWCGPCRRSYARARNKDSTILGIIRWAVRRARACDARSTPKPKKRKVRHGR